ncbi:MAG: cyclic nucleotide-binding domain-containing protein [Desulfobacterales bacterium]|jgi:CRP-like cAMP-binding protein|nr:cyclic nucleotide-binding domain-containing protein [Desulfobacterales bacterium]MDD3082905.1 cyclic nucleotide-binding domain-containing protein [Desulfobacterales bacterium]MDD3952069.1 cyclic nucleotide-binding domain-containing protein [Desulfobacterales bacterium]MDY0378834.1 cyclic nucleotide-binding domain-containing protein [Desulfobacterales bacterium]
MINKEMLSKMKIFSGVQGEKLSEIASKCNLMETKANDVIFKQGDEARDFYGLLEGEVELSLVFKDEFLRLDIRYEYSIVAKREIIEKPIVVETIHPGEVFGWSSIVTDGRWTAGARCSKPSRIFSIPAKIFKSILDKDPSLGYAVMQNLNEVVSSRLQHRTDKLIEAWGEAFDLNKI